MVSNHQPLAAASLGMAELIEPGLGHGGIPAAFGAILCLGITGDAGVVFAVMEFVSHGLHPLRSVRR